MALAIPAAIGLFSVLQDALKTSDGARVRLTSHTHAFLQDFHWLVEDVGARPTAIGKLIPDALPSTRGACDASKKGLGGYISYLVPTVMSSHCFGGPNGQHQSPQNSFQLQTQLAPSPTATWSWQPPSRNSTSWHNIGTLVPTPSTTCQTTWPPSRGNRKAPPPRLVQWPISSACTPSTSATIVTFHFTTSFLASRTFSRTNVLASFI
jgi:hypothetical protein